MPYGSLATNGIGCTTLSSTFPNDRDADVEISTVSHEQMEATTDPFDGGWYFQSNDGEIADQCAYDYDDTLDSGLANEVLHGHLLRRAAGVEATRTTGVCRAGPFRDTLSLVLGGRRASSRPSRGADTRSLSDRPSPGRPRPQRTVPGR